MDERTQAAIAAGDAEIARILEVELDLAAVELFQAATKRSASRAVCSKNSGRTRLRIFPLACASPFGACRLSIVRTHRLAWRAARGIPDALPGCPAVGRCQPSFWKASAARNTVPSSQCRPISIIPTGSPFDMPQGTVTAG